MQKITKRGLMGWAVLCATAVSGCASAHTSLSNTSSMLAATTVSDPGAATPDTTPGLSYTLGDKGLATLSYNGQSLFSASYSGNLRAFGDPVFRRADATTHPISSYTPVSSALDKATQKLTVIYTWGSATCTYSQKADRLIFKVGVNNSSAETLTGISLALMDATFPTIPNATTLEAGMFGFGFKGDLHPLHQFPLAANPKFVVPLLQVDYGTGALNFCSDDVTSAAIVSVPFTSDPTSKKMYPFVVTLPDELAPGASETATVSLRFGAEGATDAQLSSDLLKSYAKAYPFQIKWKDRRPIGTLMLGPGSSASDTNPRKWMFNGGNLDTSTDVGKAEFRKALLAYADGSIAVLKKYGAQGMITWNVEGGEFPQATYYGDPRLVSRLAPEMEWKPSPNEPATVDAYFQKFRDAGLKTGVCLRPQQITFKDNIPVQGNADNAHAAQTLKDKVAYARKRWGCTLFYVDSTVDTSTSLNPDVFKSVNDAYPDSLLMPENESMRYYAYSAPLNSYFHHGVTSTPAGARMVYPGSFSVLLGASGAKPEAFDALVQAVRHGDILLFNAWYEDPTAKIKEIYDAANAAAKP